MMEICHQSLGGGGEGGGLDAEKRKEGEEEMCKNKVAKALWTAASMSSSV